MEVDTLGDIEHDGMTPGQVLLRRALAIGDLDAVRRAREQLDREEVALLREQLRGAVEALESIREIANGPGEPAARLRAIRGVLHLNRSIDSAGGR